MNNIEHTKNTNQLTIKELQIVGVAIAKPRREGKPTHSKHKGSSRALRCHQMIKLSFIRKSCFIFYKEMRGV
jgi:hypothetical protein